ncbi:MAG: 2Fe-2S iron-sulfur cluster binding domain-containing protein [Actinomycetota bacterium]|nr:2Fe-2S iron-sulfur cluster binding domain-containing protein [Actinomycetota bacterium]
MAVSTTTPHTVTVLPEGAQFRCRPDRNVLESISDGVQAGCRNGGCGVCRVQVVSGAFTAKKMSKAHVTPEDLERNIVLACRIFATDDLTIRPCPRPAHVLTPTTSNDNTSMTAADIND